MKNVWTDPILPSLTSFRNSIIKTKNKKTVFTHLQYKNTFFFPHGGQLWAKPKPPGASPAEWLLSAPPKAAPKALRLGLGQQLQGARGRQVPLGASQFLQPRAGSLPGSLSEARVETRRWSLVSRGTLAGAAKTAPTSTPTTRAPPSAASLPWKDWTWICVRMKGMVRSPFLKWKALYFALYLNCATGLKCKKVALCDVVTGLSVSWQLAEESGSTKFEERLAAGISPTSN